MEKPLHVHSVLMLFSKEFYFACWNAFYSLYIIIHMEITNRSRFIIYLAFDFSQVNES